MAERKVNSGWIAALWIANSAEFYLTGTFDITSFVQRSDDAIRFEVDRVFDGFHADISNAQTESSFGGKLISE